LPAMPDADRRAVMRVRWLASSRAVALLATAFFVQGTSGCLSNEYTIARDELRRLASVAPEARGQGVRVSQTLGDRRSDAVEPQPPAPPVELPREPSVEVASEPAGDGDLALELDVGGGGGPRGVRHDLHGPGGGFHGAPPSTTFHGAPTVAGSGHGAPTVGGGGFHGVPTGGGGGGGLGLPSPSGGGNGNGAEILVIIAVVAIVAATAATISLAASEGMRFEGHAELAPEQLVYLKGGYGEEVVPLGELTPEQATRADSAIVKDDEGYGMRRLDHAPLERKGGVFRFDLGAGMFTLGDARASGVSAHIQAGAYVTSTFGIVFDVGLGSGTVDPCCSGPLATGGSLSRHSFGLEAQALPLGLGPLHMGAFAGGGIAVAGAAGAYESGPMASGGALLELDLTSHLALAVRGGASTAWLDTGRSSAGTITGGLSIY